MEQAQDRLEVLNKINQYELEGRFDEDVENDPPAFELKPNKVDYLRKKLSSKIKTKIFYAMAKKFMKGLVDNGVLRIKEISGIENWQNLTTGAIITCNHFNPMDSFAMQACYEASKQKRKMFKIIREGNFTNPPPPALFGKLMRNCYTLPLSSNYKTMRKFIEATNTILKRGDYILIYPEQSMWWNYRKPKPLKKSAYKMAVTNNVPVLPIFITLNDSETIGPDGFAIQEYTIHVGKPIFKNENLGLNENIENMKNQNFKFWKDVYEQTYNTKLTYTTSQEKLPIDVLNLLND